MVAAQRQPPALAFRQPSQRVIARRCVNCAYGDRAGAAAVRLIDAVDEQETRPAATEEEPARLACAADRLRLGERGKCGTVAQATCLFAGGGEGEPGHAAVYSPTCAPQHTPLRSRATSRQPRRHHPRTR